MLKESDSVAASNDFVQEGKKSQDRKYDVFISYRRDGGSETAVLICDALRRQGYRVFLDVESLRSGPFNTELYRVIENVTDFLLILPPHSLERCIHEDDWVRLEIECAKKHGKNIIPILLRGFSFPEKLPESIDFIRYQAGIEANPEYYDAFIRRICSFLHSRRYKASHIALPIVITSILLLVVSFVLFYQSKLYKEKTQLSASSTYAGEWKGAIYEGDGKYIWSDGTSFEGEWDSEKQSGNGTMTYANGDVYQGEWSYDQRNGHGTMIYADGTEYSGEWKDDEIVP